ncbi:unnamed protein product [Hyaloperonospora brassicae]|uniref:FYVE-type domain-containing protein n=1 Tax=Hyaloperonospora brassicae TaxID=162125 RepID=A0AAV0TCC0_HYABA|nr:unnamed protein product [Hyaloperonospora brassicae]
MADIVDGDRSCPLALHACSPLSVSRSVVELETVTTFSGLDHHRRVTLSPDEVQICTRLADLLLADTLRAYVDTSSGSAKVDSQQWKLVKKKDQLGAYKHKQQQQHRAAAALGAGHSMEEGEEVAGTCSATEAAAAPPLLLVTGHVAGHVHDAMYGLVSANTRAMQLNGAYADETLEDAQVLATIKGPTVNDPFRFLGIKWAVRRHGTRSGSTFVKRRDLLYLEATGTTQMTDGQYIGYRVVHSVRINALPRPSSSVVRARMSIVQLFHQQATGDGARGLSGTLNVFARGYYDPQGDMLQFMALHAGAELLLHMTFSAVDCAHLKKIAFATQHARQCRQGVASQLFKTSYSGVDRGVMAGIEELLDEDAGLLRDKAWSTHCSLCERRVGSLLNRSGRPCAICARTVCSRCSVVKKLHFFRCDGSSLPGDHVMGLERSRSVQQPPLEHPEASRTSTERSRSSSGSSAASSMNGMRQQALRFCLPCVLRATQRNASQLVVEELLEQTSLDLVTPRSTLDQVTGDARPSPMRRRSTQSGRSHHSAQAPCGSNPSSPYAAPIYPQPRQKAYSAPAIQRGVHRSSPAAPRVMLYVEDPRSHLLGYSAA